jgi:hypothetical protein
MNTRIAVLCAVGALYFPGTTAGAATAAGFVGAVPWVIVGAAFTLLCVSILVAAALVWRRRAKKASLSIAAARERSLQRHTQRLAAEFAEPEL